MQSEQPRNDDIEQAHFGEQHEPDDVRAWEQVDTGRYMPRRIKGSCRGRALG
jgi:hypothetical protein